MLMQRQRDVNITRKHLSKNTEILPQINKTAGNWSHEEYNRTVNSQSKDNPGPNNRVWPPFLASRDAPRRRDLRGPRPRHMTHPAWPQPLTPPLTGTSVGRGTRILYPDIISASGLKYDVPGCESLRCFCFLYLWCISLFTLCSLTEDGQCFSARNVSNISEEWSENEYRIFDLRFIWWRMYYVKNRRKQTTSEHSICFGL